MCISVCVHTCRATSADGARLKAVNETCVSGRLLAVGDKNQLELQPHLFSAFFGFFEKAPAASLFLWMVPHTAEISVCSPDPHFSSPPLWLLNTRSCYNVWVCKVPIVWFLHLGWNADRNAGMSRSRVRPWWEKPLYHFQSAWWPLCSQACVIVCIAANWAEMGRWKETVFYSIFSILFYLLSHPL